MLRAIIWGFLCASLAPGAEAQAPVSPKTFRISRDDGYGDPLKSLQRLAGNAKGGASNTFCVLGYREDDGTSHAWVYWKEGKAIILWEPTGEPVDLMRSRRFLKIPRDVVPDENSLGGSTYLVTEKWVADRIAECKRDGKTYTIRGSQSSKPGARGKQ